MDDPGDISDAHRAKASTLQPHAVRPVIKRNAIKTTLRFETSRDSTANVGFLVEKYQQCWET